MKIKGFTLLELMIVVAVIGILAAIAWPRYQQYVIETNRTDGKGELLQVAQELERCYTINNTYAGCGLGLPRTSDDGFYLIQATDPGSASTPPPSTLSATSYTLYAVPQKIQKQDAVCGTLTLTQAGARGESGTGTAQECW